VIQLCRYHMKCKEECEEDENIAHELGQKENDAVGNV
jgi:hypothetical protein